MKIIKIICAFLLANIFSVSSQTGWDWAKKGGGSASNSAFDSYDNANDITVDHTGEVLVTGYFRGPGTFGTITLNGFGDMSGFIAKYDNLGNTIWAKEIVGGQINCYSIAVNSLNEVFVSGSFNDSASFSGTKLYTNGPIAYYFLAKYSANGVFMWAQKCGAIGGILYPSKNPIDIDALDNIYMATYINKPSVFDTISVNPAGSEWNIVTKYNTSGNIYWLKTITGNSSNRVLTDIECDDQGNLYLTGGFDSKIIIDGNYTQGAAVFRPFLVKFNTSGVYQWIKVGYSYNPADQGNCRSDAIGVSPDGSSIYVAGTYENTFKFDSLNTFPSSGYPEIFLAKFSSSGHTDFVTAIDCSGQATTNDISCDNFGNFFVAGTNLATLTYGTSNINSSNSYPQTFILSCNANGAINFWNNNTNVSAVLAESKPNSITNDQCGNPLIAGYIRIKAEFGSTVLNTNGTDDMFIAKHGGTLSTPIIGNKEICSGETTTLSIISTANNPVWMPGSITGPSITVSPGVTTTYSVTSIDSNSCNVTAAAAVTVYTCMGIHEQHLVAGGQGHSMSVCSNQSINAWGYNSSGQLGNGNTLDSYSPVPVNAITNIASIDAGKYHSIALKNDGTVYAWGQNTSGQLGDGTNLTKTTPVLVSALTNVVAIAAGDYHSAALKNNGTIWCWGKNTSGQLGDGTFSNSSMPLRISALSGITSIALGSGYSLALKNDGTVWKWGNGNNTPTAIPGLSNITAIAAGEFHFLALRNDSTVWVFGGNNSNGEFGNGTTNTYATPVQASISGVKKIAAGMTHCLATKNNGTVWGWGLNNWGQLGDGTITTQILPVQAIGLSNIVSIEAGDVHSLAVKTDGTLYGFGQNFSGQLGNSMSNNNYVTPIVIPACQVVSVNDISIQSSVNLYPNPVEKHLFIESNEKIYSIKCINSIGKLVNLKLENGSIDVTNLPDGVYFISLYTINGEYITKKIIKK